MKKVILLAVALLALLVSCKGDKEPFKVMTFNIRYDNPDDKPYHWDARLPYIGDFLHQVKPAVMGVQEALNHQLLSLDSIMEGYSRVGVGRDDGFRAGEFAAIYYDTTRFGLVDTLNLWLSDTPTVPSKGWDGACPRVLTIALLYDKINKEEIYFFNTHFDHVGVEARSNSAKMVDYLIDDIVKNGNLVLMGDLNASIEDEPINYMITEGGLIDSRYTAFQKKGNDCTYHNWGKVDGGIIDFIMYKSPNKTFVIDSNVIDAKVEGMDMFLSDHNPVVVLMRF